jgi:TPR repeat protein
MGARAIAALKKFQADHSLPATGQLDRKTLDALSAKTPASKLSESPSRGFSAETVRKSASQGSAPAEYRLGLLYDQGWGEPLDHAEAIRWWRKAAGQGNASAQAKLGKVYYDGDFVPQDYAEGISWYRRAAEQGGPAAETRLGNAYLNGDGTPQSWEDAAHWYRKAAEQGHAPAQFLIGMMLSAGRGVPQDYLESYVWLSIAYSRVGDDVQRKDADLRGSAAKHLTPGQIDDAQRRVREWKPAIDENLVRSVGLVREAAELEDATAQTELGEDYDEGNGVPQDHAEAARWYLKAADLGDPEAQVDIGIDYEDGVGVLQDYAEAARWFRKAADRGKAKAQLELGLMYRDGKGVPKDDNESLRMFRSAANQGNAVAQVKMAAYYAGGEMTQANNSEGYMWMTIALSRKDDAIEKGVQDALITVRGRLAQAMSADQVAEAERRAREWRPTGEGSLLKSPLAQASLQEAKGTDRYRVLTPEDGLSCEFSQDLSISTGYGLSGQISGTRNHFDCTDKAGKSIAIQLKSAGLVNGKVGIVTKDFGTILKGNEEGSFDKYEMTESQIAKLKKFLGL